MKRFLLISGLFLLFAANASALTCYDGFTLETDPNGVEYCRWGKTYSPVCTNKDDVYHYYSVKEGKCKDCPDDYTECWVGSYYENGAETISGRRCNLLGGWGCVACNRRVCTKCSVGVELRDGRCYEPCPENCSFCSSSSTCTMCNSGYTLENGQCVEEVACPADCVKCDSSGFCTQCDSGYTLENGQCVKKAACPANCAQCNSSGVCTKCNGGYKLKNGACEAGSVISCPDDMKLSADGCCCMPN